jgi:hypothetical protein
MSVELKADPVDGPGQYMGAYCLEPGCDLSVHPALKSSQSIDDLAVDLENRVIADSWSFAVGPRDLLLEVHRKASEHDQNEHQGQGRVYVFVSRSSPVNAIPGLTEQIIDPNG